MKPINAATRAGQRLQSWASRLKIGIQKSMFVGRGNCKKEQKQIGLLIRSGRFGP
jgi:hypothetical protein